MTSAQHRSDPIAHYRQHSVVTDPGPYAELLRELPRDVGQLIEIVGGMFIHFKRDVVEKGLPLEQHRRSEVDARFVRRILEHTLALDPRPLDQPRPFGRRYLGTCRDAGVLLCSILRTLGIPARVRYYFAPLLWQRHRPLTDHILVEYWQESEQRWRYADSRLYKAVRDQHEFGLDPTDIPDELLITSAQAWLSSQKRRRVAFDISGYAFDPAHGLWKARNIFMYDLASLTGWEPLLWDAWGYMLHTRPYVRPKGWFQFRNLNELARLDPRDPEEWRELMRLCRMRWNVRVPGSIRAFSSINGHRVVPTAKAA
jgi:hypothetical protein